MNSSSSSSTRSTTITSAFSGDLSLRRRVTARKNNNNFNDASSLLSSSGGIGIGDDNDDDDTNLVESIVQRMLNDRPSLGLVQKETKSKIQDAMNKRVLSSSSSSSSSNIVNNSIPLNSNTNKRGRYKHKHYYATSPIVQYMNERCYYNNGGGGTIYVAYVGEGLGKTTACYAFSKMNPKNTIVALTSSSSSSSSSATTKIMDPSSSSSSSIFLPHNSKRSSISSTGTAATICCLERMISLFKLRWGNVPQGFVTTLIQSLHNNNDKKKNTWIGRILPFMPLTGRRSKQGSSIINNHNNHDNRKLQQQQQQQRRHNNKTNKNKTIITKKKNTKCSYLIIDDFMSNGSTNSASDIKFVRQLQKLIANTYSNVCVFLLTSNKESANYLLSLNNDNPNNTNNNNNNIVDDIDNHYNIDDRRINNNMNNLAIQPLGNISVMDTIRLPSGRRRIENKRTKGIDISDDVDNDDDNSDKGMMSFDWDRLCSMEWTIQQIQDAIILSENENMNNDSDDYDNDNNNDDNKRQDSLREEIAELLTYMPDEERKTINPLKVKRLLARSVNYHPPIISTTKSKSLIVRNGNDTGFIHGTSSIFENDYSSFQQQHKSPSSTTAATKNNNNNHHPQYISDAYSEMV